MKNNSFKIESTQIIETFLFTNKKPFTYEHKENVRGGHTMDNNQQIPDNEHNTVQTTDKVENTTRTADVETSSDLYKVTSSILGVVGIFMGGLAGKERMDRPAYQKVQQALGNAPQQLQEAIITFQQTYNAKEDPYMSDEQYLAHMKQSIDMVTTAHTNISTAYKTYIKEFGPKSYAQQVPINLIGLRSTTAFSIHPAMQRIYSEIKGERTLTTEERADSLDEIMSSMDRVRMDAVVQQQIDNTASGNLQTVYAATSLTLAIIGCVIFYKGFTKQRKKQNAKSTEKEA